MLSAWFLAVLSLPGDVPRSLAEETTPLFTAEYRSGDVRFGVTGAAHGRVSLPLGFIDDGKLRAGATPTGLKDHPLFSDLFNPGIGFTLEFGLVFERLEPELPRHMRVPAMGPYVALQWDRFNGEGADDDSGVEIRPEDMTIRSILVGFKAEGEVYEDFWGDLRVGIGGANYDSVDARFSGPGVPTFKGELFDETRTIVMECRMHFGYKVGPLLLAAGAGARMVGGPDDGRDFSGDTNVLFLIDFDLAVELWF